MAVPGGMATYGSRSGSERAVVALVCLALVGSCAGVAIAAVIARALDAATLAPAVAGSAIGMVICCALWRRVAARLPGELDGWFRQRRILSIVWCATAALAVANVARLGLFAADPHQVWASAVPPVGVEHQCLAAYVRAGELAAHGQADLWNRDDYEETADASKQQSTKAKTAAAVTSKEANAGTSTLAGTSGRGARS